MAKNGLKDCCRKLAIEIATAQGSPLIRSVIQAVEGSRESMLINWTDVMVLSGVHQVSTTRHRIGICTEFPPCPTA